MPIRPEGLPAQNQSDIKQPEEYDLEEFSPGLPRLNSDRYAPMTEVRKRERPQPPEPDYVTDVLSTSDAPDSKQDPASVVEPDMPADSNAEGAEDTPVPLYPGE